MSEAPRHGPLFRLLKGAWVGTMVGVSLLAVLPLVLVVRLEGALTGNRSERLFNMAKELLAPVPTIIGSYLRSTFYWATCEAVHPNTRMLLGSMVAHRNTRIGRRCVLGCWTIVGAVILEDDVLVGSRCSILTSKHSHRWDGHCWEPVDGGPDQRLRIGAGTWIGDQAVVMASLGRRCIVGAGAVVYHPFPDETTLLGNPARRVSLQPGAPGGTSS